MRRRLLTADENRLLGSGSDDRSRTVMALMLLLLLMRIGAAMDELRVMKTRRRLWPKLMNHVEDDALEHVSDHLRFVGGGGGGEGEEGDVKGKRGREEG